MEISILTRIQDVFIAAWIQWWHLMSGWPGIPLASIPVAYIAKQLNLPWLHWIKNGQTLICIWVSCLFLSVILALGMSYDSISSNTDLWYPLTQTQLTQFYKHAGLPPFSLFKFEVTYDASCDECEHYSFNLKNALTHLRGWEQIPKDSIEAVMMPDAPLGIIISVPADRPLSIGVSALSEGLQYAHIPFRLEATIKNSDVDMGIYVGKKQE